MMEPQKIIFNTFAYNAEKTISRTIESVLSQTFENWVYYCLDNGATDRTGSIIRKYAEKDSRIIPLANKKNHVWEKGNSWVHIIKQHRDEDMFCTLDADDEYKPDFAKKMIEFMNGNSLDIAACGNDFIDGATGGAAGARVINADIVIEGGRGFSDHFSAYYQYMRAMWGKLYKISVLRRHDFTRAFALNYGGDTLFAIENFRNAKRVGIIAESLHKYYISHKSASFEWDEKRIESDRILDSTARAFLIDKCGSVSRQNDEFLLKVYHNAIKDTLIVLLNSRLPVIEKMKALRDVLTCGQTQRLVSWQGYKEEKSQLLKVVMDWLLAQKEGKTGEGLKIATEILFAADKDLLRKNPLLQSVGVDLAVLFPRTVQLIIKQDYKYALRDFIEASQNAEIPDSEAESYILLGQNLAAAAENSDIFIYFKKMWISYLLDCRRYEKAGRELDEFEQLLPGDEDFAGLRARI